jgi:hypothetical protein
VRTPCTLPKFDAIIVCCLLVRSGCSAVLVDDASEDASSSDRRVERDDDRAVMLRRVLREALVWTVPVEMGDVLHEHPAGYCTSTRPAWPSS